MIRRQLLPLAVQLTLCFGIRPEDYGKYRWVELKAYVDALPKMKG